MSEPDMRPELVCGWVMYPSASSTAMSLRTVALDTPRLCRSTRVLEPIGSRVETKSATMARSTSKRRSSVPPTGSSFAPPPPS